LILLSRYLKEHKKAEYTIMLIDGTLRKHIVDTDIQAKERLEILMKQIIEKNSKQRKVSEFFSLF